MSEYMVCEGQRPSPGPWTCSGLAGGVEVRDNDGNHVAFFGGAKAKTDSAIAVKTWLIPEMIVALRHAYDRATFSDPFTESEIEEVLKRYDSK